MKLTLTILIIISFLLPGCTHSPTQKQYDQLQEELNSYKELLDELRNTPQQLVIKAQRLMNSQDYTGAEAAFQEIVDKCPGTREEEIAKARIAALKEMITKKKEIEERRKTLGFKSLTETTTTKVGDARLHFSSITDVQRWTFDSYGDEWHYRAAERGNRFIVAKVKITADSKSPNLPPICIYKMSNGQLNLVGTMMYRFSRWDDYGSYLGNYADYGNDFAHSRTISFSCGLEVSSEDMKKMAFFVIVKKANCFSRSESRFDNPSVSYIENACDTKQKLIVEDFDNEYILVRIFNKKQL